MIFKNRQYPDNVNLYDAGMGRLTRAESQTRNRQSLLSTARELFLREGYQATSIAKVAEAAGFTTGAVYSNFGSKAEMALVVLGEIQRERMGELGEIIAGSGAVNARLDALRDWAERAMDSGWPRLELEFAVDARASDALVAAEADRQRSAVDRIAGMIEDQLAASGFPAVVPARDLADAAVNLVIGLAIRRLVDPKVTPDRLIDLLRGVLAGREGDPGEQAGKSDGSVTGRRFPER